MQHKSILFSMLFAFLFVVGCDDDNVTNPETQMGTLRIHMTDAPARFEAVSVTFAEFSALVNGEWVSVQNNLQTVNLLELNNGKSTVVAEAELPVGQYNQLQIKIGNATAERDGQTYPLNVSNEAQTGLDIATTFTITTDETYDLLIDFDVHRSIVETDATGSGAGEFMLKPMLRTVSLDMTGAISGEVATTANAPLAFAISGSDTITSTAVDTTSGEFKLAFLPPGDYTVSVEDSSGAVSTYGSVSVTVGSEADLGILSLQAGGNSTVSLKKKYGFVK